MICLVLVMILSPGLEWSMSDLGSIKKEARKCTKEHESCLSKFTKTKEGYLATCKRRDDE